MDTELLALAEALRDLALERSQEPGSAGTASPPASGAEQCSANSLTPSRQRRLFIATAESCTGGWVAEVITHAAGSSAWFDRGFVTYSNEAKQDMLGVRPETLAAHGAVSEETAAEMAAGALAHSRATFALSITGIAGPTGGSSDKPVGTVCFGWCVRDGLPRTERRQFAGDREAVRRQAVIHALNGLAALANSVP